MRLNIGCPVVRTDGRAVYDHAITKLSQMGRFTYPWCSAGALRARKLRYKLRTCNLSSSSGFERSVPHCYHNILLARLKSSIGINGTALNWFTSYLNNSSQRVSLNGCTSDSILGFLMAFHKGRIWGHLL